MKLTQITLDPRGDSYYALFVGQKLWDASDDYHGKLSYKIKGIISFLEFANISFDLKRIELVPKDEGKEFFELNYLATTGDSLDKYLKQLKKDFKIL